MRILFLSSWLPYPLDNGSKIRAYHLLRALAHRHEVSATMGQDSPATAYYMTRNVFLFLGNRAGGRLRFEAVLRVLLRELRTVAAYSIKPRYRHLRLSRDICLLALRDAFLARWGEMGADVHWPAIE